MKNQLIAALLVAASASLAAPAFASGYGPAPFYRPSVGAPASQRGPSAQTIAAERNAANSTSGESYGGVVAAQSESGRRQPVSSEHNDANSTSGESYGGVVGAPSESGHRQPVSSLRDLYKGGH